MAQTKSPPLETLHDLLILKLQSLLDIENELVKALQKMAKASSDTQLKEAFERHLGETENHVKRAEKALVTLGAPAKKNKSAGIRGLEEDTNWIIKTIKNDAARDAALIGAAQYAEHYEMAGYGSARAWAEQMRHSDVVELLQATLEEEKAADQTLTGLALHGINERANPVTAGTMQHSA